MNKEKKKIKIKSVVFNWCFGAMAAVTLHKGGA